MPSSKGMSPSGLSICGRSSWGHDISLHRAGTGSGAPFGGDASDDLADALERGEVDPLDVGVRSLARRPEEHGRDAGGGDQRGVRPEQRADVVARSATSATSSTNGWSGCGGGADPGSR